MLFLLAMSLVLMSQGLAQIPPSSSQQQVDCVMKAVKLNITREIYACTCLNISCPPAPPSGAESSTQNVINITTSSKTNGPGLVTPPMIPTVVTSTKSMGNVGTTTKGSYGSGVECLQSTTDIFTKEEALCYCMSINCPEVPNQIKTTTERWYGTGHECIIRTALVYNMSLTAKELSCLCFDNCPETDEEFQEYKTNLIKKGIDEGRNKISDGFIIAFLSLILITGILGNLLVIVTVVAFMGKTTITNLYICNLAVADLLVILVCVPYKIVTTTNYHWDAGDAACKVITWLYFGSFMCSVFTLATMSLERFLVICYPMLSHVISSTRRTAVLIAITWIAATVLSCPTLYVMKEHEQYNSSIYLCSADMSDGSYGKRIGFYVYIYILIFLIPISLMSFAYIRTSVTLWKSIKKQLELKNSQMKSSIKDKVKKKPKISSNGRVQAIRVLIIVLVVFTICWFPYLTTQLIMYTTNKDYTDFARNKHINEISKWFNLLSLANSCLNPILYGFLSKRFREGFLRCIKCDRKSINVKKGSVITATSSVRSIHKQSSYKGSTKMTRTRSNGSLGRVPEHTTMENGISKQQNGLSNSCIDPMDVVLESKEEHQENGYENMAFNSQERDKIMQLEEKLAQNEQNTDKQLDGAVTQNEQNTGLDKQLHGVVTQNEQNTGLDKQLEGVVTQNEQNTGRNIQSEPKVAKSETNKDNSNIKQAESSA